jgi:Peptidase A4 family
MRRIWLVLLAVTLALAPFLLMMAPADASAASPPIDTPNYAGYSLYHANGNMIGISGSWTVPQVNCPLPYTPGYQGNPRVAMWVGMWGTKTSVENNTAWLPQIGVVATCHYGLASYFGFWEMATNVTGGGALTCAVCDGTPAHPVGPGPQCLNNPAYPLGTLQLHCSSNFAAFTVSPGNHISAEVRYVGPTSNGDLDFDVDMTNTTLGSFVSVADIITTKAVPLDYIAHQGGLIVEDNNNYGGLVNFAPPIALQLTGWGATGSGAYEVNRWEMWVYGKQLTTVTPLSTSYAFTVTWKSSGCLLGAPCPPP